MKKSCCISLVDYVIVLVMHGHTYIKLKKNPDGKYGKRFSEEQICLELSLQYQTSFLEFSITHECNTKRNKVRFVITVGKLLSQKMCKVRTLICL